MTRKTYLWIFTVMLCAVMAHAQLVEDYRFKGKVVDTKGKPVGKARIVFKEASSGKEFTFSAADDGSFDRRMIPHAVYDVTFTKTGYASRTERFDWDASAPETIVKEAQIVLQNEADKAKEELGKKASKLYKEAYEALAASKWDEAYGKAGELLQAGAGPYEYAARFVMARSQLEKGAVDAAIAEYRKVVELKPDLFEAHFDLGTLLEQKAAHDDAVAEFKTACELQPADAEAQYSVGAILVNQKKLTEAKTYLNKALELQPDHAQASKAMGFVYLWSDEQDLKAAHGFLQKYLELLPNASDKDQISKIVAELAKYANK